MKQLNQKTPWVFRLGVALLCVMLMTTHLTGNLYARYSTTATGSDSARVAKFDVKVESSDGDLEWTIKPDDGNTLQKKYQFAISSDSEVAYRETVTVSGVPNGVEISATVGGEGVTGAKNGTTYTVSKDFSPGSANHSWNLTFKADKNTEASDMKIGIDIVQLD